MRTRTLAAVVAAAGLLGCGSAAVPGAELDLEAIELPDGFEIEVWAADVPGARSMVRSPEGTVFVGTRGEGMVYALVDEGAERRRITLAEGLQLPNGVDFRDGDLYVAENHRVLRFDDVEESLEDPPEPVVVFEGLPEERHHGWRYARFGPDGRLFLGIGAPCNVCDEGDPFATVSAIDLETGELEVYARGVRNTVGFDWHPETGILWFTDNGRDWLGDDQPPDELNRAPEAGLHFGFPHCHGADVVDPEFGTPEHTCDEYRTPAAELGPHVAALGIRFYRGESFPAEYRGRAFIAEHGSWNRSVPIGYRITILDVEGGEASGYRPFASGWLQGEEAWGRPVDLLELQDGSLLVSDDHAGVVYRIYYEGG